MGTRIGIEIGPAECRIVEIDAAGGRGSAGTETRIRSFSVTPKAGGDTRRELARLRGREAAVVAWGLRADHRQAVVRTARYDAMRREAMLSLRLAGVDTRGVLTDIAPAGPKIDGGGRRPVVMALASRNDLGPALRPLKEAGIRIRSVVTPAAALASIARVRAKAGAADAGAEVYVALEETATCIALLRNRALVAARELPWGYVQESEPFGQRVPRDKTAVRLADELTEFFESAGIRPGSIGTIHICGTLPKLRSITAPIMERLAVEIEPLDSMFCVDVESFTDQTRDFRERGVELRLAWAAAADWRAPLNLLRDRNIGATAALFARAAVVAGASVGLGAGWMLQQTTWLEASSGTRRTHAPAPRPAPGKKPVVMHEPPDQLARFAEPPLNLVASVEPMLAAEPQSEPERVSAPEPPQPAVREPISLERPAVTEEIPELGSILFGPDRKLAMIDGRIVETGDEVRGGMVVEISPTVVTLRDSRGRLKRLSLGLKKDE